MCVCRLLLLELHFNDDKLFLKLHIHFMLYANIFSTVVTFNALLQSSTKYLRYIKIYERNYHDIGLASVVCFKHLAKF